MPNCHTKENSNLLGCSFVVSVPFSLQPDGVLDAMVPLLCHVLIGACEIQRSFIPIELFLPFTTAHPIRIANSKSSCVKMRCIQWHTGIFNSTLKCHTSSSQHRKHRRTAGVTQGSRIISCKHMRALVGCRPWKSIAMVYAASPELLVQKLC